MRRDWRDCFIAWALVFALALFPTIALADVAASMAGFPPGTFQSRGAIDVTSSGSCSQSTALLARMDGSENHSAVDTLVCGMVTDGTWSLIDALYILAVNSTGNAALNWVSTSFSLTKNGICTFTANAGYACDGSTGYLDTGLNPSTLIGNFSLNSALIGVCVLTSRTSPVDVGEIGASSVSFSTNAYINPFGSGSNFQGDLNAAGFPTATSTNAQGSWIENRTSALSYDLYKNGSFLATLTDTSFALPNATVTIGGLNVGGTVGNFSSDQIAVGIIAGGMTSTQVGNVNSRIHTYLTTIGASSGC